MLHRVLWTALLLGATASRASAQDTTVAVSAWVRHTAAPINSLDDTATFRDLAPLRRLVGEARVIAFGEPAHGLHEFLAFRNRLLAFLVRYVGVTAIAVESGYTETAKVDDYVNGRFPDTAGVTQAVFTWAPYSFQENWDLITWLREYNASPDRPHAVHFYGIDLPGAVNGQFLTSRQAVDSALRYLGTVDTTCCAHVLRYLSPYLDRFADSQYDSLLPRQRDSLTEGIALLNDLLAAQPGSSPSLSSRLAYLRARHNVASAQLMDAAFRAGVTAGDAGLSLARDSAMATNVQWALAQEGPQGRLFLFAHNVHVQKVSPLTDAYPHLYAGAKRVPMGHFLATHLGSKYRVIGGTFGGSSDSSVGTPALSASVDGLLGATASPLSFLDLHRPHTGLIASWLTSPVRIRVNDRYELVALAHAFDGLLSVRSVSEVHLLQ